MGLHTHWDKLCSNLRHLVHTFVPLSPSSGAVMLYGWEANCRLGRIIIIIQNFITRTYSHALRMNRRHGQSPGGQMECVNC